MLIKPSVLCVAWYSHTSQCARIQTERWSQHHLPSGSAVSSLFSSFHWALSLLAFNSLFQRVMLHHHWATAMLPPIFLNGGWRLWNCLVAMAASAFTFSPHSVQCACFAAPPPKQKAGARHSRAGLSSDRTEVYLPPAPVPNALSIQSSTLHFPISLLLMHSISLWQLSKALTLLQLNLLKRYVF